MLSSGSRRGCRSPALSLGGMLTIWDPPPCLYFELSRSQVRLSIAVRSDEEGEGDALEGQLGLSFLPANSIDLRPSTFASRRVRRIRLTLHFGQLHNRTRNPLSCLPRVMPLPLLSGPPPRVSSEACRKCGKKFNLLLNRSRTCGHDGFLYCQEVSLCRLVDSAGARRWSS
jgi:hypothetical protein